MLKKLNPARILLVSLLLTIPGMYLRLEKISLFV